MIDLTAIFSATALTDILQHFQRIGAGKTGSLQIGCFEKATWYSEVPGLSYTQIKTAARKKEGTGSWLSASDPGHFPPFHPEQYVR